MPPDLQTQPSGYPTAATQTIGLEQQKVLRNTYLLLA